MLSLLYKYGELVLNQEQQKYIKDVRNTIPCELDFWLDGIEYCNNLELSLELRNKTLEHAPVEINILVELLKLR